MPPPRPRGPRRGAGRASVAAGLALTIAATPAIAAAAHWSPPIRISAKDRLATYPSVEIDGRGTATALWIEARAGGAYSVAVTSERRADRRRWEPPRALSRSGSLAVSPQLSVAPNGAAVAAWNVISTSLRAGRPPAIDVVVRRSRTASWSKPVRISRRRAQATLPSVAIDDHGRAVAVWSSTRGRQSRIEAATATVASDRWSAPRALDVSKRRLLAPRLALDGRGDAIAVWKEWESGGPLNATGMKSRIVAAIKPCGRGSWLPAATLGQEIDAPGQGVASFDSPGPRIASDWRGDAFVAWQGRRRGQIVVDISARRAGSRRWSTPVPISTAALAPDIAMDRRGDATAVWVDARGRIDAAAKPAAARSWRSPTTIGPRDAENAYPHVAMDRDGDAIATWTSSTVRAAERHGARGSWLRAVGLGSGGVPRAAIGPRGEATVVWQRPTDHPFGIAIDAASDGADR